MESIAQSVLISIYVKFWLLFQCYTVFSRSCSRILEIIEIKVVIAEAYLGPYQTLSTIDGAFLKKYVIVAKKAPP